MDRVVRCALVFICITVCVGCGRDRPLLIDTPVEKISVSLEEEIPRLMDKYHIPGLSVLVIRNSEVAIARSFGYSDIESRQKTTSDTIYKAASLGKPVFAYLTVELARRGIIDLDKPLIHYDREPVVEGDPRSHQITARMVLSHTAGLPNLGGEFQTPLFLYDPGEGFEYSGHGYLYLQRVIETMTGRALDELADDLVFRPLGMTHSSYRWREEYKENLSSSYNGEKEKMPVKQEALVGYSAWSLYATMEDYARFVIHIMTAWGEPGTVSSRMLMPAATVVDGVQWGLGWGLQDTQPNASFWHWGSMAGFRHYVVGYPKERVAVIVMSNGSRAFKMVDDVMAQAIGGSYPSYDWF